MRFDYLVVGAGTSGCALAARLSEEPGRSVLLLEAGAGRPLSGLAPAPLRDAFRLPRAPWDWGLQAGSVGERRVPLPVGKVVGGTSQVNGAGAWRPLASDFDAWAALGLPEWDWAHVAEAFNRVETDLDFGERPWHGAHGPLPVTRWGEHELLTPMRGWLEALRDAGHPWCEDLNAPNARGVGVNPQSRRGRERVSAADAYLLPALGRPGLTLRTGACVERVALDGETAVGVVVDGELVEAGETILCAGTPLSPALLLRSGVGPAECLRAVGVEPRVDVAGVGAKLRDQPAVALLAVPAAAHDEPDGPFLQLAARLASFPGFAPDDRHYQCLFAGMPVDPALRPLVRAERAHWLIVGDLAPASTGTVALASADPADAPVCELGFYGAADDLARMRSGVRAAWALARHPAFAATIERVALVAQRLLDDDARLDELVAARTMSRQTWGGCAMGPDADPEAVVDGACRVRGVARLRVADASIVPVPLRAGGALTCLMLAERLAERLVADG